MASELAVIVPVLDEAARIGRSLRALAATPGVGEVIVVDGGSADCTVEIARSLGRGAALPPRRRDAAGGCGRARGGGARRPWRRGRRVSDVDGGRRRGLATRAAPPLGRPPLAGYAAPLRRPGALRAARGV